MKDIKSVSLVDRRGYLTVALEIGALTPQQFTTSTISNYQWYFVRHCRERKFSNDSTLHVFPSSDGEMAGLVLRKPEGLRDWYNLVQKQVSVTPVWHKCDTSVTQVWQVTMLMYQVKEAKARVMLSTEQFWAKKAEAGGGQQEPSTEEWLG